MKNIELVAAYPFTDTATPVDENFLKGKTAEEWLKERFSNQFSFGLDNLLRNGYYKLLGNIYKFNMPKFLYKKNGEWREAYAPNKTYLRKAIYGRIDKIILLED